MKRTFAAILQLPLLAFCLSAQIPTNGLIGGWPFSGNALDMSGNSNHGTVFGAALTTDRFGASNSAYSFNGSSNYIVMSSAGPTGTVSRSVSFWAKTSYSSGISAGFNYGDAVGTGGIYQIMFNYNCQGVGFDNSNAFLIRGGSSVNNNQWHHIVAVLNATNSTLMGGIDFYIDGVLQTSVNCGSTSSAINSNSLFPITIGKSCNSSLRYFNGQLDDFYMYNRAISSSEVLQLYNYTPCTAAPAAPAAVSGPTNSCLSNNPPSFSIAPVTGAASYTWSLPSGWPASSTTLVTSPNAPYSGTIGVASVNACGQSAYSTLSVNINPAIALTLFASSPSICAGGVTNLTGSGANSYSWSNGSTASTLSVSPSITTTYTLTGTATSGCSTKSVITIFVNTGAMPVIQVSGSGVKCPGEVVNLASNGAATYTWQPGNLNGFFVSVTPTVTTVYTVSGMASNGCVGTTTYTQVVQAAPLVTVTASLPNACEGTTLTLTAAGAASYTWMPGFQNSAFIVVTASQGVTYSVTGDNGGSCRSQPTAASVQVNALPVLLANSGASVVCKGQPVTLGVSGAVSYTWQPGNLQGFLVNVTPSSSTIYTVSGTSANNCVGSATIMQVVKECLSVTDAGAYSGLNIFPNPFSDDIHLECVDHIREISVHNSVGAEVFFCDRFDENTVRLSHLPAGAYLLFVRTDTGASVQKIIKLTQ